MKKPKIRVPEGTTAEEERRAVEELFDPGAVVESVDAEGKPVVAIDRPSRDHTATGRVRCGGGYRRFLKKLRD